MGALILGCGTAVTSGDWQKLAASSGSSSGRDPRHTRQERRRSAAQGRESAQRSTGWWCTAPTPTWRPSCSGSCGSNGWTSRSDSSQLAPASDVARLWGLPANPSRWRSPGVSARCRSSGTTPAGCCSASACWLPRAAPSTATTARAAGRGRADRGRARPRRAADRARRAPRLPARQDHDTHGSRRAVRCRPRAADPRRCRLPAAHEALDLVPAHRGSPGVHCLVPVRNER